MAAEDPGSVPLRWIALFVLLALLVGAGAVLYVGGTLMAP
jgi:hypothetical protein